MFDSTDDHAGASRPAGRSGMSSLTGVLRTIQGLERDLTDAERIDLIRLLEEIKGTAAAAQAVLTADFRASQLAEQTTAGVRPRDLGKGIGSQVALARRESPHKGNSLLGLARALVDEMPHTLRALTTGRLNEWRVTLLVRETACLSREDRQAVDRELAADPSRLEGMGNQKLAAEAKKAAYRLDPHAVVRRARKARTERRVTCRPAPDTMAYLTALLPAEQAVAVYAALTKAADTARCEADPRGRGQVMADTLVERVTGQATAAAGPVELQLVMTDSTLLTGAQEPAHLIGYGPLPAGLARDWVSNPRAACFVRRLYTRPTSGELVALESTRRRFHGGLRRFLVLRDGGTCRTPWCDAPIRHGDHAVPHDAGGRTNSHNGQGLCELCNQAKQAPRWRSRVRPGPRHSIQITTPTGHTYRSTAPPQPGWAPRQLSPPEEQLAELLRTA